MAITNLINANYRDDNIGTLTKSVISNINSLKQFTIGKYFIKGDEVFFSEEYFDTELNLRLIGTNIKICKETHYCESFDSTKWQDFSNNGEDYNLGTSMDYSHNELKPFKGVVKLEPTNDYIVPNSSIIKLENGYNIEGDWDALTRFPDFQIPTTIRFSDGYPMNHIGVFPNDTSLASFFWFIKIPLNGKYMLSAFREASISNIRIFRYTYLSKTGTQITTSSPRPYTIIDESTITFEMDNEFLVFDYPNMKYADYSSLSEFPINIDTVEDWYTRDKNTEIGPYLYESKSLSTMLMSGFVNTCIDSGLRKRYDMNNDIDRFRFIEVNNHPYPELTLKFSYSYRTWDFDYKIPPIAILVRGGSRTIFIPKNLFSEYCLKYHSMVDSGDIIFISFDEENQVFMAYSSWREPLGATNFFCLTVGFPESIHSTHSETFTHTEPVVGKIKASDNNHINENSKLVEEFHQPTLFYVPYPDDFVYPEGHLNDGLIQPGESNPYISGALPPIFNYDDLTNCVQQSYFKIDNDLSSRIDNVIIIDNLNNLEEFTESSIETIGSEIDSINSSISSLNAKVTNLENTVNGLSPDVFHVGASSPANLKLFWIDTSAGVNSRVLKVNINNAWVIVAGGFTP